jgi:hypothetical protein
VLVIVQVAGACTPGLPVPVALEGKLMRAHEGLTGAVIPLCPAPSRIVPAQSTNLHGDNAQAVGLELLRDRKDPGEANPPPR